MHCGFCGCGLSAFVRQYFLQSQILRLYHAEKWRVGTISAALCWNDGTMRFAFTRRCSPSSVTIVTNHGRSPFAAAMRRSEPKRR